VLIAVTGLVAVLLVVVAGCGLVLVVADGWWLVRVVADGGLVVDGGAVVVVVVVAGVVVGARVGLCFVATVVALGVGGVGGGIVGVGPLLVVVRLVYRLGHWFWRWRGLIGGLGACCVVGLHKVKGLHKEGLLNDTLVVLAVLVVLLSVDGIGAGALVMLRGVGVVLHCVCTVVAAGRGGGHLVGVQGHAVCRVFLWLLELAQNAPVKNMSQNLMHTS